jgi:hypothetical protein
MCFSMNLAPHFNRLIIDLNIPLSAIAAMLVLVFLRMKAPAGSVFDKLKQIDWV